MRAPVDSRIFMGFTRAYPHARLSRTYVSPFFCDIDNGRPVKVALLSSSIEDRSRRGVVSDG